MATSSAINNSLNQVVSNNNYNFRNKIINGNFDIWQRGTTNTTHAKYAADRWRTLSIGSTFTSSQQTFNVGQTSVPNNPKYFHRTAVTSIAGSSNYCCINQYIEDVSTFSGQTVTLSFWAKADNTRNIAIEFLQNFGTGGSPSAFVAGIGVNTITLTSSWTKFTITVSIPSISGKTIGTDGYNTSALILLFWFDAGNDFNSRTNNLGQQSGTFDISQVQLEKGSVATDFEMRPYAIELNLCQRYYQTFGKINGTNNFYNYASTYPITFYCTFPLATTIRVLTGTVTISSWYTLNASQPALNGITYNTITLYYTSTTSGNSGTACTGSSVFTIDADF